MKSCSGTLDGFTKDWFADRDFRFSRYWIRGTDQKPKKTIIIKLRVRGFSTFKE